MKLNHLNQIITLATLSLGLLHCNKKQISDIAVDGGVDTYSVLNDKIEYYHGGWYGPVDVPNFEMHLTMTVVNGKVQGKLETPTCTTAGAVAAKDYANLEKITLNGKTQVSKTLMADAGDQRISLSNSSDSKSLQTIYLREGSSSYNKPVLSEADAAKVEAQLKSIAQSLIDKDENCSSSVNSKGLVSVRYQENTQSTSDQAMVWRPYPQVRTDITVTFANNKASIKGYKTTRTANTICNQEIDGTYSNPNLLKDAAGQIRIITVENICARAMVDPAIASYSVRSLSIERILGNTMSTEMGYLGCEYSKQAQFSEQFVSVIDSIINSQTVKHCFVLDPLPQPGN